MKPSFNLPKNSRQYDFVVNGPDVLSDTDVLKLICGNDISLSISEIKSKDFYDLKNLGLTNIQSLRLLASLELKKRYDVVNNNITKITSSKDIYDLMSPLISDISHEEFWMVYLNRANYVIAHKKISQGGLIGTVTDVKIILRNAINLYSLNIIAVHNHPSGNIIPSIADKQITEKLKNAALLMDIQLLDHVIISGNKYYSFADEGIF